MELLLTQLSARRVIYSFEGVVTGDRPKGFKVVFYNNSSKNVIEPTVFEWDGDVFRMLLHVESTEDKLPLKTGDYYLIGMDAEGNHYDFTIAEEILEERSAQNWRSDVSVNKNKGHQIICTTKYDEELQKFFIRVKTILPKPRKNYIRRKCAEHYYGIIKDFKDFSQKLFVFTFNIFNKICKKKGNKILFCSGSRAEIGGNEEFIYKRMVERGLDKKYKFVFDFKPTIKKKYGPFKMIRFIYRLASSDVILLDDYYPEIYKPDYDSNVKIMQVWHACGAFKALGLERMTKAGAPPINTRVHKCYTHVPVSSYHSALHHQEAFGIGIDKFYPVGIPRTDIFFDEDYKRITRERMHQEFPGSKEAKRVIMYAPTFRGNSAVDAYFPMDMVNLEAWGEMCKRTGSFLIVKMHPFVQEHIQIPEKYKDCIADAADYREVNDILFITDVLITDYSSIIYEFSLLKRPMLFYAFDQNSYVSSRNFYEPYEDIVPGRIIHRFDELLECIENEDYDVEKLDWFVRKNFTYTDGKATDRVIDLIIQDDVQNLPMSAISAKGALAELNNNYGLGFFESVKLKEEQEREEAAAAAAEAEEMADESQALEDSDVMEETEDGTVDGEDEVETKPQPNKLHAEKPQPEDEDGEEAEANNNEAESQSECEDEVDE